MAFVRIHIGICITVFFFKVCFFCICCCGHTFLIAVWRISYLVIIAEAWCYLTVAIIFISFTGFDILLFKSALFVNCPYKSFAVIICNYIIAVKPYTCFFSCVRLSGIRFYYNMLTEYKSVNAVKLYIEWITGRWSHFIWWAAIYIGIVVLLRFSAYFWNCSCPCLCIINSWTDYYRHICGYSLHRLFVYFSFYSEITACDYCHYNITGCSVSAVSSLAAVRTVYRIYFLYSSSHFWFYSRILNGVFKLFKLSILNLNIIFRFGNISFKWLYLCRIWILVIAWCILFICLELCYLLFHWVNIIVAFFNFKLSLLKLKLHSVNIISKEFSSFLYLVAFLDKNLLYLLWCVIFYIKCFLGFYHSGKTLTRKWNSWIYSVDIWNRCYKNLCWIIVSGAMFPDYDACYGYQQNCWCCRCNYYLFFLFHQSISFSFLY